MKRLQKVTLDTHPDMSFIQEWDDEQPDETREHRCVKVIFADGTESVDPIIIASLHDDAIELNRQKNLVLVPALLDALPASEKIAQKDENGKITGYEFKNYPSFRAVNGEIVTDMTNVPAAQKAKFAKVLLNKDLSRVKRIK